jgi:hypothetical protein
MPKYCFASWATLPLGLLCLFGLLCLLGYFASWAALPLGLLCLFGLLCLLGCLAYWAALPLGLCLIDTVYFDNAGIPVSLLGCAITGHLLICKMISYVNMPNRVTLLDRI